MHKQSLLLHPGQRGVKAPDLEYCFSEICKKPRYQSNKIKTYFDLLGVDVFLGSVLVAFSVVFGFSFDLVPVSSGLHTLHAV